nr:uncharacterized protein LOC129267865 [Lytechinus pictus]
MTEEQVLQCAEDLKSFYRERMCKIKPDPLDFNLIVEFEQLYTNLVLLKHDKGLTREKSHVDYKDLFTTKVDGVLPKRLLVEGEGGVGKTTLCSKIAWDWAEGYEEYNQLNWVVVVPLRNVIKGQTIGDCMKNYLNENNIVSPKQIENYMICQPSKVLIVLDGLDEYDGDPSSTDDGSDISQVLRLDKFQKCTVLVTTRPWRADQIKCNQQFGGSYAFIEVEGFSAENVSTYISKYFVKDVDAGKELIRFIEVNDVIKENMAPFPIYVALLCILWENTDSEKREIIRRLKTFSQLFEQMIIFLRDHYVLKLKATNTLNEERLENEFKQAEFCIKQIGSVAFSGLLVRKLVFKVNDFRSFKDAMETCCKIGVLSRDHEQVSRWKRSMRDSPAVTTNVFFPHKLFQEYVAALYLASLHETDLEEYRRSMGKVTGANIQEFRYLLYFTAAQVKEIGLEIVKMLQGSNQIHPALMQVGYSPSILPNDINYSFLVDVTFEAYDKDIAKVVGQHVFAEKRTLEIDENMSAHTVSGYLFIMEQHQVETLELRRHCGPTVSRDIADLLSSPSSLSTLVLLETDLDDEFYSMTSYVSKRGGAFNIVQELYIDDRFLGGLHKSDTTIKTIFPNLKRLRILTLHTVSPVIVKRLAQTSLEELSIERAHDPRGRRPQPVPLVGEPVSLGQLFSDSFPQLTSLVLKKLMIGNIRIGSILQSLKKNQHLKSIR